tara:strand:+ start:413 stop:550 length:138 start_codon:yes stop_codon:yes gene_type:complete
VVVEKAVMAERITVDMLGKMVLITLVVVEVMLMDMNLVEMVEMES